MGPRSDVQAALREFLDAEAPPERVRDDDENHRPPTDLLRRLGSLGYLTVGLPPEWGGHGGTVEMVEVMEEIGRSYLGLGNLVGRVMYAQQLLLTLGTDAQKEHWLPRLSEGTCVFSISFTEPEAGSELANVRTAARPDGDGFVLTGQKVFSSSFGYADLAAVLARTSGEPRDKRGLSVFLVDPRAPGIECRPLNTVGDWTSTTYEVFYTDVRVPADDVLGGLGQGWRVARAHLARERLMMAARAIGATAGILAETIAYLSRREQFGHPLADFQVVRHKLADIGLELRMARAGLYDVARDAGSERAVVDAAMVKVYASELYARASATAVHLHGGMGYTRDLALQRHLRDAPMYVIGGGSAEVLRDVIARDLLTRPIS